MIAAFNRQVLMNDQKSGISILVEKTIKELIKDDRFQYKLRIFEVVGDAGLIASIETTEEFSKAMISMLRSDTKEHYRQQGIRHVKQYTWRRAANLLADVCMEFEAH